MSGFTGKVALVTGAGSGIGFTGALFFARESAKFIVTDVNGKGGQETVRLVQEASGALINMASILG